MGMNSTEILQLGNEGRAEDLRNQLRDKAYRSLYYFSKVIMTYKELVAHLHLPGCDWIQSTALTIRKRGLLWPRGHFKSTMGKGYALWSVLPKLQLDPWGNPYPEELVYCHDPNTRILYVSESADVAAKNLRDIKWNVENNQILRWLFPELIPPNLNDTKWTDDEILLPRSRSFDEPTITTKGVGGKGTGFHYDKIIYDDIIGEEASHSEAKMQDAIEWFKAAPGLMNDQETAEELILGTRWKDGSADLYGWIEEHIPDQYSWNKLGCYDEDGEPIFPERFSREKLNQIRRREGEYLFACNYLNDPTAPEGADFQPDWIRWYDVSEDKKTLIPTDGTPPILLGNLLRISFYDVSAGGKSATAENAIVGTGQAADKRLFALEAWSENCTAGRAVEEWHRINDRFIFYKNYYEQVSAQKAIEDINRLHGQEDACPRCKDDGRGDAVVHRKIRPIGEKPPGGKGQVSKEERIRLWAQKQFETHGVYLRRGAKGMEKLKKQIIAFPHGRPIDLLDCLAYCCHLTRPPLSDEDLADERERREEALTPRESRVVAEVSYGGYI